MHAFDYVMTLMSFVYALAIAHVLATAGDIIAAGARVRFSWLNAAWMLFALFGVLAWWVGLWGLRQTSAWSMQEIAELFVLAAILYLDARIVCMRVAMDGPVDLRRFHAEEGRKYMTVYAVLTAATVALNVQFGVGFGMADIIAKNRAVLTMFVLSVVGAIFLGRRVQIAVAVALSATWVWYFSTLQGALT